MKMKKFNVNIEVYFGEDSLSKLSEITNKKVFIVTDSFMEKSGVANKVSKRLNNCKVSIFSEIVPDPSIEIVTKGVDIILKEKPEVIIAIGGGSAIDAAKAIVHFARKVGNLSNVQFIAIPTTSGTGSEVTSFSVITDNKKGVKYPLVSDDLLPDIAILDAELVKTAPNFITADTGMDVITHGLEAYVSKNSTDFSDALAEKALVLAFEYLPKVYKNGQDLIAREKMHTASCLAGIAFNQASLGINHSIAHVLGGKFHIPHGRTNAILLPYVIDYNADIVGYDTRDFTLAAKKYCHISKLIGLPANNIRMGVKNLISEIKQMQKTMKLPITLKAAGVDLDNLKLLKDEIARIAMEDVCTISNPKAPTKEDVLRILERVRG